MISPSSFAVRALKFLQKSMMLTPWGPSAVPTGGAGVALPAAIWSFTIAWIFLAMNLSVFSLLVVGPHHPHHSNLFHLQEIQFHRRRASEDRHHHLQRVLVEVHLVDHAVETGERAFVDPHVVALVEAVLRLGLLRRGLHL